MESNYRFYLRRASEERTAASRHHRNKPAPGTPSWRSTSPRAPKPERKPPGTRLILRVQTIRKSRRSRGLSHVRYTKGDDVGRPRAIVA